MININYNGGTFQLRNEPNEIKLKEFEGVYNALNDDKLSGFEKYFKVFEVMGVPADYLEAINDDELMELIKAFNDITVSNPIPVKSIEIGGRNYVAYEGDEFKFSAKDLVEIEKAAKRGCTNFPSYCLAVIFKDDQLTPTEHRTSAHINHKASIFADNLSADFAIPYLSLIAKRTLKNLEKV
jgi:hypothetical protein